MSEEMQRQHAEVTLERTSTPEQLANIDCFSVVVAQEAQAQRLSSLQILTASQWLWHNEHKPT